MTSWGEFVERAAIGPLPGLAVVPAGLAFRASRVVVTLVSWQIERRDRTGRHLIASG